MAVEAADAQRLGRQLAVIYEGAAALSTSCDDAQVIAAATLVQAALGSPIE